MTGLLETALAVKEGRQSLDEVPKRLRRQVKGLVATLPQIGVEALKGEGRLPPRHRTNKPHFRQTRS